MSVYGRRMSQQIYQIECKFYRGMGDKIVFYFVVPRNAKILNVTAFKVGRFANQLTTAKFHLGGAPVVKSITANILSDINLEINRGGIVMCEIGIPEIDQLFLHYIII